jgi:hypothetical protein
MRWRPLKLSQILETIPGWNSSLRTATGPHKGRLTLVSIVLPNRAQDYLANRAPLAVAPFKASKTERQRIAIDLFEVLERGSVWEIEGVMSLADWDEGPGRTGAAGPSISDAACSRSMLRTARCWPLTRLPSSPIRTDGRG